MQRTENFNLGLWEGSDFPNYTMPNENMNTIDTALNTLNVNVEGVKQSQDSIKSEFQALTSTVLNEITERELADRELSVRISENANAIEDLDDNVTKLMSSVDSIYTYKDGTTKKGVMKTIKTALASSIGKYPLLSGSYGENNKWDLTHLTSFVFPFNVGMPTTAEFIDAYAMPIQDLHNMDKVGTTLRVRMVQWNTTMSSIRVALTAECWRNVDRENPDDELKLTEFMPAEDYVVYITYFEPYEE